MIRLNSTVNGNTWPASVTNSLSFSVLCLIPSIPYAVSNNSQESMVWKKWSKCYFSCTWHTGLILSISPSLYLPPWPHVFAWIVHEIKGHLSSHYWHSSGLLYTLFPHFSLFLFLSFSPSSLFPRNLSIAMRHFALIYSKSNVIDCYYLSIITLHIFDLSDGSVY